MAAFQADEALEMASDFAASYCIDPLGVINHKRDSKTRIC
jgi:hypothetical protein